MFSRRQLFTRLSAIALTPLVKLLPKTEAPAEWYPTGWGADLPDGAYNWTAYPCSSPARVEKLNRCINNIMRKQLAQAKPIPQEEA
jgi:hypothetical protein